MLYNVQTTYTLTFLVSRFVPAKVNHDINLDAWVES